MKYWTVFRDGAKIGTFLCENVLYENGNLFAMRGGYIIGSLASGPGLTWESAEL